MKSLKANYFFSVLKTVMTFLFPIVTFPYATRVLGVSNLGIVSYCSSLMGYFGLFATLGTAIYATREGAKLRHDKEQLTKFSKEIFTINFISTVIVYIAFLFMLFFATEEKYFMVMLLSSLGLWFSLLQVEWLYQIEEEFSYISIREMAFQVISLILLFTWVKTKEDYVKYAFIQTIAGGGSCFLNILNARKYVSWKKRCKLELKKHMKPILTIFGISAASSIYINMDTVMLKWMHSEYEVGLYTAAVKMNGMVKSLVNSLSVILLPRLSNYLGTEKKDEYKKLIKNGFSINMGIAIPSAVGLFMIAEYVILLFSGNDYLGAITASRLLSINLIFAIIDGMIYYQIMLPHRLDKQACAGTIVGALTNLVLNFCFIPKYGINGAAFATVLSELFVFAVFSMLLSKTINVFHLLSEVPRIVCACVPIVGVCLLVLKYIQAPIVGSFVAVVSSVIVYVICGKLLKCTIVEEGLKLIQHITNHGDSV